MLNLSLSKGYFDAKFCKSELLIFPSDYKSFWNIDFYSGSRYFFGEITFYGNHVKKEYLRNLCNIQVGTYYDNQSLIEFNRRLFATNWFNSIAISQNFIVSHNTRNVPIKVLLVPSIASNFKVSIGCSNDDIFGRLKIIWKKPCLNIYGHSFENIFGISVLEQFVNLNYRIPLVHSPLHEYYLLQGDIRHDIIYNKQSNFIVKMDISRYWDSVTGWKKGFNLHCCYDHCSQLKNSKSIILVYPGISIHRIRQKGGTMPIWGHSQYHSLDISNILWKSHTNFFHLQSKNTWIRTLFHKHRLVVRNNFRWIEGNDLQSIFSFVRRFFFISDYLIRGYSYQSLFFENILLHSLIIPSKLIINSLEYQYNIFEKWWSVLFIDTDVFFKNINCFDYWRCAVGFGIRWETPVGPVKLDVAIPLLHKEKDIFKLLHIYVGLGPEL